MASTIEATISRMGSFYATETVSQASFKGGLRLEKVAASRAAPARLADRRLTALTPRRSGDVKRREQSPHLLGHLGNPPGPQEDLVVGLPRRQKVGAAYQQLLKLLSRLEVRMHPVAGDPVALRRAAQGESPPARIGRRAREPRGFRQRPALPPVSRSTQQPGRRHTSALVRTLLGQVDRGPLRPRSRSRYSTESAAIWREPGVKRIGSALPARPAAAIAEPAASPRAIAAIAASAQRWAPSELVPLPHASRSWISASRSRCWQ